MNLARLTLLALLFLLLSLVLARAPAAPAAEQRAEDVVEGAIDRALEVLRDESLRGPGKRDERIARLRAVADEVFDWNEMARRSLGVHWRDLDEEKREEFVELFPTLLAEKYMSDLDQFRGDEKVLIEGQRKLGDATEVQTTVITHARERVPIHYFLHQEDGEWLVHDVSIEGVSLVNHYRSSFNRFLVNRSFDELLERLRRKHQAVTG